MNIQQKLYITSKKMSCKKKDKTKIINTRKCKKNIQEMNRRAIFRVSKIRLFPSQLSACYTFRCFYNCFFEDACKQPEILHFSLTIVPCCFCYNFDTTQVFSAFISFPTCKLSPWFYNRSLVERLSKPYPRRTHQQLISNPSALSKGSSCKEF